MSMATVKTQADDLRIIRDVLSVQHVPVVGSLQWDQLQKILQTLVERLTVQELRLDKAEEGGKLYKNELEFCKNSIKEIQDLKESEQNWTKIFEERIGGLQQELDATSSSLSHAILPMQNVDFELLQTLPSRVDTLEVAAKHVDSLTAEMREKLNEQIENEAKRQEAESAGRTLQNLSDEIDALQQDLLEQIEDLHSLEVQHEQVKLLSQQTSKAQARDLEALQKYCRNLHDDLEIKRLLEHDGKLSEKGPTETEKATPGLEKAVSELQSRLQKKADIESVEQLTRTTQSTKEAIDKLLINVNDLQIRMPTRKATLVSAASRRWSRLAAITFSKKDSQESFSRNVDHGELQLQGIPQNQTASLFLPDEIKEALKGHERMLQQLVKGVLIMSGHDESYALPTKQTDDHIGLKPISDVNEDSFLLETLPSVSPLQAVQETSVAELPKGSRLSMLNEAETIRNRESELSAGAINDSKNIHSSPTVSSIEQCEELSKALEAALLENKIQPKENVKTASKWFQQFGAMEPKLKQIDALISNLCDGLILKADKIDMQKIARLVHEILNQPERALFTGRPLLGFKCMSCDHPLEKMNPYRADHVPTNMMPKQVLPMLSAERIFATDRKDHSSPRSPKSDRSKDNKNINIGFLRSSYTAPLSRRSYSAAQGQRSSRIK